MVVFIIKNAIDLDLSDEIDPVWWKRTRSSDFITVTHTITSLFPIIPQSLWLAIWNAIGMLASHASWSQLEKISPESQIFLRHLQADLDLIMNTERFQTSNLLTL